mmetsp:Transcript_40452/g.71881  ORF Transcript_40452/g.71881 Transcript_40452/m.71881 type:complete len:243 (+) Transcript_40452:57-785(+)
MLVGSVGVSLFLAFVESKCTLPSVVGAAVCGIFFWGRAEASLAISLSDGGATGLTPPTIFFEASVTVSFAGSVDKGLTPTVVCAASAIVFLSGGGGGKGLISAFSDTGKSVDVAVSSLAGGEDIVWAPVFCGIREEVDGAVSLAGGGDQGFTPKAFRVPSVIVFFPEGGADKGLASASWATRKLVSASVCLGDVDMDLTPTTCAVMSAGTSFPEDFSGPFASSMSAWDSTLAARGVSFMTGT